MIGRFGGVGLGAMGLGGKVSKERMFGALNGGVGGVGKGGFLKYMLHGRGGLLKGREM